MAETVGEKTVRRLREYGESVARTGSITRVELDHELLAEYRRLPRKRRKELKHLVERYRVACELSAGRIPERCAWWRGEAFRVLHLLRKGVQKEKGFAEAEG